MIKAGIWDLGGVLFTNGTKLFVKEISEKYGLDPKFVLEVMDGPIGSQYRESQISKDEFWAKAIKELNIKADPDELNNQWIDGYHLIEGTRDLVQELRANMPQYYLSDNVEERVQRINERTGFLKWFDGGLFSYEADVRKPNPKFYELGLQRAGVRAEDSFFVDDKESALVPFKEMGGKVILFTTPEECRKELEGMGLLPRTPEGQKISYHSVEGQNH